MKHLSKILKVLAIVWAILFVAGGIAGAAVLGSFGSKYRYYVNTTGITFGCIGIVIGGIALGVSSLFILYALAQLVEDSEKKREAEAGPRVTPQPVWRPEPIVRGEQATQRAAAPDFGADKPWFCRHCGMQNEAGSRFCFSCGKPNQ